MCDFQLIAGLSTIISGFSQLQYGITLHHWVKMTQLAWFACITHLCCLTFLRDHLHQNKLAQAWRVPAMVIMITMLIIALIPTEHYVYTSPLSLFMAKEIRPYPADPALHFFFKHNVTNCDSGFGSKSYTGFDLDPLQNAKQRMILTSCFLGWGLLTRLWHLFQTPTNIYLRIRKVSSKRVRIWLHAIYRHTASTSLGACIVKTLMYRPAIALFLSFRYAADIYTSKVFEVI